MNLIIIIQFCWKQSSYFHFLYFKVLFFQCLICFLFYFSLFWSNFTKMCLCVIFFWVVFLLLGFDADMLCFVLIFSLGGRFNPEFHLVYMCETLNIWSSNWHVKWTITWCIYCVIQRRVGFDYFIVVDKIIETAATLMHKLNPKKCLYCWINASLKLNGTMYY